MASNEYHFISDWRAEGSVKEVSDIITDTASLPQWWPSVYLNVTVLKPGLEDGTGKVVRLLTRGWLPYSLDWTLRVTESRHPHGFTLEAEGDFNGRGIWRFVQDGSRVLIRYDWKIRADKPLLRTLSFAFKPVFEANHRWAMERGERSLTLELGDGVPAVPTSWPPYLHRRNRQSSRHSSCGCSVLRWFWQLALVLWQCFEVLRRGDKS